MSGDAYEAGAADRGRRRRATITVVVVLLLLFFAFWYAMSYIRADGSGGSSADGSSARPACTASPKQVEVNVYNATRREGLAAQVATELKQRGFTVKTVANDPKNREISGRGELRYGDNSIADARLVLTHTGAFQRLKDDRKRPTVDVVIGPKFRQLVSEPKVAGC